MGVMGALPKWGVSWKVGVPGEDKGESVLAGMIMWDGGNRSEASASHCCSLPNRQTMNTLDKIMARHRVNHAPSGTFVSAEER